MRREQLAGHSIPLSFTAYDWRKLRQSPAYDVLMRLPFLSWTFFVATVSAVGLLQYLHQGAVLPTAVFAINVAMRLSTFVFIVLLAGAVIARARPEAKARGAAPPFSALLRHFLIYS